MRYSVSIDVPSLEQGLEFYGKAFGFKEVASPVETYSVAKSGNAQIGLMQKAAGSNPAPGSDDVRRYDRHGTPVHIDFQVEIFEEVLAAALDAGAICEQKFQSEEHPSLAFCSDPFGNGFCIIGPQ